MIDLGPLEAAVDAAPGSDLLVSKATLLTLFREQRRLEALAGLRRTDTAVAALCVDIAAGAAR